MKNTFFSLNFGQNRYHSVHLLFQISIFSKLNSYIPIDEADRIAAVKLDMIGDHIIFLKDCRQCYSCIQYSISFNIQFLIHHNAVHLNSVKIRNRLISVLRTLHKNAISVKINVTVKISDASDCFFLFYADTDGISVQLGNFKCIYICNVLCICSAVEQWCKDRIGSHRSPKHHILYFFVCIMGSSPHLNSIYFIIEKKYYHSNHNSGAYHTCQHLLRPFTHRRSFPIITFSHKSSNPLSPAAIFCSPKSVNLHRYAHSPC